LTKTNAEDENSSPRPSEIDSGDYQSDQSDDKEYCKAYENEGYRFVIHTGKIFLYTD
jgi:hypothetical protein